MRDRCHLPATAGNNKERFVCRERSRTFLHRADFVRSFAMLAEFDQQLANTLAEIRSQGLYKTERIITSPQAARIEIAGGRRVLNMCAHNCLVLAGHPALSAAAKE